MKSLRIILSFAVLCVFSLSVQGRQHPDSAQRDSIRLQKRDSLFLSFKTINHTAPVEFFAGADVRFHRLYFNNRVYDWLIYITPGMKWHFGRDWQVAVQGMFPIVNQWGAPYGYPRLGVTSISKELQAGSSHFFKFSGGIFSMDRYGLDVKWMWPVTRWFALEAQLGYTGYYQMASSWKFSAPTRVTGNVKARFYIPKANTEFRLSGGRYSYADWGVKADALVHFNFTTVGVFGQWGGASGFSAGFKAIFMIPGQKGFGGKKVRFRPASSFILSYDVMADHYALRNYATDPEENDRTGSFSKVKWGVSE